MLFLSVGFLSVALLAVGFSFRTGSPLALLVAIPAAMAAAACFALRNRFQVAPPLRRDDELLSGNSEEESGATPPLATEPRVQIHHGKE